MPSSYTAEPVRRNEVAWSTGQRGSLERRRGGSGRCIVGSRFASDRGDEIIGLSPSGMGRMNTPAAPQSPLLICTS